jgi:farnesyl-diphosphate farnesyltransferase
MTCDIDAHGALPDNAGMSHHPAHRSPPVPAGAWGMVRDVARSFAISLQLLPAPVRWPVALAYLLARASDSVADAVVVDAPTECQNDRRLLALDELQEALHAATLGVVSPELPHVQNLLPHIPLTERRLLATLPTWLDALHRLPVADQQLINGVCGHIFAGQRLDLQRFAMAGAGARTVQALTDLAELDDYTYQVAGCVGPFWTHICEAHLPDWRRADLDQMVRASLAYGQALQLLNILRDTPSDLALGRCYWPHTELSAMAINPDQLAAAVQSQDVSTLQHMQSLMTAQGQRIRVGLSLGLAYSSAIGPWRLRAASALPALIGLRTLQDIESAGLHAWLQPVKVARRFVRHLMWQCVWGGLTPSGLKQQGVRLGASEPHLHLADLDGTMPT